MTTKEIKALASGGLHKLGEILLKQNLPEELHESLFWGLSIGSIEGVLLRTFYKERVKGKLEDIPIYLDENFTGDKIKFELR